jgi:hypothetical protein
MRKKLTLAIELQPDGRPARPSVPDPRKTPSRFGQRLLPQLPSVAPSKIYGAPKMRTRHTAKPK